MITFLKDFSKRLTETLLRKEIFIPSLFVVFSLISFFFGRVSKIFDERPIFEAEFFAPEHLALDNVSVSSLPADVSTTTVFASKKGKKYYFLWCTSSVSEKNKVFFKSEQEAKMRGYTRSSTCK